MTRVVQVAVELYGTSNTPGASERDSHADKAVRAPGAVEQAAAGGDDGAEPSGEAEAQAAGPRAANLVDKRSLMDKLDKLMQRYDSNGMARCGWLDLLALRRIDQLNQVGARPAT